MGGWWGHMPPMDVSMLIKVKNNVSLLLWLHNDINKSLFVPNAGTFSVFRNKVHNDANMEKTLSMASKIDGAWIHHAHNQSWSASSSSTFGSQVAWHYYTVKAITLLSEVQLRSMSTWWKCYLISFQMDLISPQYHIGKVFKSSWQAVAVSTRYYDIIVGMIFTLETLTHHVENTSKMTKDVLLGHHLRRQARASKPKLEAQSISSLSLSRTLGATHAKTDAQVAYGLRFRWSTYPYAT
jgi:hypothetical protein